jgi:hypothetical protein
MKAAKIMAAINENGVAKSVMAVAAKWRNNNENENERIAMAAKTWNGVMQSKANEV